MTIRQKISQRQLDTFRWSRGDDIQWPRVHSLEHKYMQKDMTIQNVPPLYFRESLQWYIADSILSEYETYQQGRMEGFKAGITIIG